MMLKTFRWFSKNLCDFVLWMKEASALERVKEKMTHSLGVGIGGSSYKSRSRILVGMRTGALEVLPPSTVLIARLFR